MKSSSTNGLRWILALALLAGGARAHAQSASISPLNSSPILKPNSASNLRSFRAGTTVRKDSQDSPPQPTPTQQPSAPVPHDETVTVSSPPGPLPITLLFVRIVDESGKVLVESPANISVQPGKTLERDQVADSIRTLYKTGTYSYIAARLDPTVNGIGIDFVVREQLFFNQVIIPASMRRLRTHPPPPRCRSRSAIHTEKKPSDEGVTRLTDALHDEGLYQAEVQVETVPHLDTHEIDVIVNVKSGPRAKVQTIQLTNGTEYTNEEIIKQLSVKVGKPITSQRIQRGTQRIHNFLVKKGHLNARASVRRGPYDKATNTIPLEVEITEGPRVQLVITGLKLSQGTRSKSSFPSIRKARSTSISSKKASGTFVNALSAMATSTQASNTRTVTRDAQPKGNWKGTEEIITYKVERGDRHKLGGIEVAGNHYFNTELLRARLQIYGKGFATRGRFSRRLVESDRDSLLSLYQSNGFLEAKVDAQTLDNYKGVEGQLFVRYVIQEGKQSRVASLSIDGNHAFKEDDLLPYVASTPGQPYSD